MNLEQRHLTDLKAKLFKSNKDLIRYRFAIDKASIFTIVDRKGKITYINDQFSKISEFSEEELLGSDHRIINSGYHDQKFFEDLWKTISIGKIWRGEIKNKTKYGKYYWVDTTIVPFIDEDGRPYEYIAIRNDITEKKIAEEELEAKRATLVYSEKMASLGLLSSGIAHELGNPLGALRGRMEMLKDQVESGGLNEESVLKTSETVISLVDRMSKIIKGLSSYARDGSADPMQKVSIKKLLEHILDFCEGSISRQNVKLSIDRFDEDIKISCRETEVEQVFVNLLSNAVDAIKEESDPWVAIHLSEEGGRVLIEFEDSGLGITPDVQKKIFDPFYTTKAVGQGTGLGLSISKSLVENNRGTLSYCLKDDHTCFAVDFPRA